MGEAGARHSPCASAAYQDRNGPGAEAGSARAGAVPLRALTSADYTIGKIKAGPAYFVIPGTLAG